MATPCTIAKLTAVVLTRRQKFAQKTLFTEDITACRSLEPRRCGNRLTLLCY
ncbi:hypothetical protein [Pseudanabaena sp. FACHB-1998]|uniref:hypothetical protein n=1 Tax=Pseudanabaena sp. FACHB-1998 TaxID=2692858 RepID=UPI0024115B9F|nr:hypothetical protein [Pseudanabaena sp. FACHB-1998]